MRRRGGGIPGGGAVSGGGAGGGQCCEQRGRWVGGSAVSGGGAPGSGGQRWKQAAGVSWREVGMKVRRRRFQVGRDRKATLRLMTAGRICWCFMWIRDKFVVMEEGWTKGLKTISSRFLFPPCRRLFTLTLGVSTYLSNGTYPPQRCCEGRRKK